MTTLVRTDPHRPGAIIPSDYEFKCWYVLDAGEDAGFMDDYTALVDQVEPKWFQHPVWGAARLGKCSVCGAIFRTGEVWMHRPTGEHIHIGHDCTAKYRMLNAYADAEIAKWHKAERERRAVAIAERKHAKERDARRIEHADLFKRLEALKANEHASHFAADFAAQQIHNIDRKGWLPTEKQLALLTKLEAETIERANQPVEVHVPAPTGRVTFTGKVVSVKEHESDFGLTLKMTVKVTTPEGVWLAWMTVPQAVSVDRGDEIVVKATLSHGKDPFFAFGKRPTVLKVTEEDGHVVVGCEHQFDRRVCMACNPPVVEAPVAQEVK